MILTVKSKGRDLKFNPPFFKTNIHVNHVNMVSDVDTYTCGGGDIIHTLTIPQPYGSFFTPLQIRQCLYKVNNSISPVIDGGAGAGSKGSITRCTNTTHVIPFCPLHMKEVLNLEIKPSTIYGAGDGLFASRGRAPAPTDPYLSKTPVFARGDLIYYFEGELLPYGKYEERYGSKYDPTDKMWWTPYAAQIPGKERWIVDCISARGVLACANDSRDSRVNMVCREDPTNKHRLPCYASKEIFDGEEIFFSYGDEYWDAFDGVHPSR